MANKMSNKRQGVQRLKRTADELERKVESHFFTAKGSLSLSLSLSFQFLLSLSKPSSELRPPMDDFKSWNDFFFPSFFFLVFLTLSRRFPFVFLLPAFFYFLLHFFISFPLFSLFKGSNTFKLRYFKATHTVLKLLVVIPFFAFAVNIRFAKVGCNFLLHVFRSFVEFQL